MHQYVNPADYDDAAADRNELIHRTAAKTVTAYNAAKNGCHSNYPDDNGRPDQPESQKAKTDAGKKRINGSHTGPYNDCPVIEDVLFLFADFIMPPGERLQYHIGAEPEKNQGCKNHPDPVSAFIALMNHRNQSNCISQNKGRHLETGEDHAKLCNISLFQFRKHCAFIKAVGENIQRQSYRYKDDFPKTHAKASNLS